MLKKPHRYMHLVDPENIREHQFNVRTSKMTDMTITISDDRVD